MSGKRFVFVLFFAVFVLAYAGAGMAMTPEEQLGKFIYFDQNLSNPAGQACADCHHPTAGFADPDHAFPVSEGILGGFGGRSAPTSAYAAYSPYFSGDPATGYVGGQFWDGRAATLADQAKGPFLNPVEMNNSKEGVVAAVAASEYADLFRRVYGPDSLNDVETAYNLIAEAIAAYEGTAEVNRFSSKFDLFMQGKIGFTAREKRGLKLFMDPAKGNCAACHTLNPADGANAPVFTDFTYDNLGIPHNYEVDALAGTSGPDLGLGGFLAAMGAADAAAQNGKFKVPTLRNIAATAPYGHNGYFKSLKEIVHFYNTRDTLGACNQGDPGEKVSCWPAADVEENKNIAELGNLGLSSREEDDIVAFLMALTDGYSIGRSGR